MRSRLPDSGLPVRHAPSMPRCPSHCARRRPEGCAAPFAHFTRFTRFTRFVRFALFALFAAAALSGLAAPRQVRAQPVPALEQLRSFVATAQSARGSFVQQTVRAGAKAPQRSEGVFAFGRPGRFRWEIHKPYEQLLVADGEQLYFYDRDLEQVTVRSVGEAIGASPASILFGAEDIDTSFALSEIGARDELQWLSATPRARDAGVERIEIGFDGGLPRAMQVLDSFGGMALLRFEGLEVDPALPADTFRFVPPPGADVIRQ